MGGLLGVKLLRPASEEGLGGDGGDGIVDYRSADFAREVRIASTGLDHVAMVAVSPDEVLSMVPAPDPDSLWVLEQLAL